MLYRHITTTVLPRYIEYTYSNYTNYIFTSSNALFPSNCQTGKTTSKSPDARSYNESNLDLTSCNVSISIRHALKYQILARHTAAFRVDTPYHHISKSNTPYHRISNYNTPYHSTTNPDTLYCSITNPDSSYHGISNLNTSYLFYWIELCETCSEL